MTRASEARGLVSVVIPSYNSAQFLDDSIGSVLAQTYSSVEIIVVDDGSTDDTAQVLEKFEDRVTYVRQENRGVASARNHGLSVARGEFILFLDADDWLYPESLADKVEYLGLHETVGLVHGRVEVTDADLRPTGEVLEGTSKADAIGPLLRLIPPAIPGMGVVLRMAVAREINGFDEELGTSADYDFWLRVASRHPVGRVPQLSAKYRKHHGSMYTNVEAQLADMQRILAKHRDSLGARPEWSILIRSFYRSIAGEYKRRGQYGKVVRTIFWGLHAIWKFR